MSLNGCNREEFISPTKTKPELLQQVPFGNNTRHYELDQLANERGHQVVRFLSYHCQYNFIALVWAQMKGEVTKEIKTFKTSDVERLLHE
jgi:hypothetical protein